MIFMITTAAGALIVVWVYLVWMVRKKKANLFHDQVEPKTAERRLKILKTAHAATRPDMLLADKDALALPGQQRPTGETPHPSANNYGIIAIFEFCHVTSSVEPLRISSPW